MTGVQSAGHEVLGGIGVDGDAAADGSPQRILEERLPGPPPRLTQADMERMLKNQKKAVKRAHKEAKKVSCGVCLEAAHGSLCNAVLFVLRHAFATARFHNGLFTPAVAILMADNTAYRCHTLLVGSDNVVAEVLRKVSQISIMLFLLYQAKKAAKKAKRAKLEDAERHMHAKAVEPSGRYQPAGASDSSISCDSPPRQHRHESDDREARHDHSYVHRHDEHDRHEANDRRQHHARSSRSPTRHDSADTSAPDAEGHRRMSNRSHHSQNIRHRQNDSEQHRLCHRRTASPPRRRHRTRSPS